MANKGVFTKILSILGTASTAFVALAPLLFGLAASIRSGRYLLDWLLPGEWFPAALAGGLLLLWAALRARSHRLWIGLPLGLAVALIVAGITVASVSGLASGAIEPQGVWYVITTAAFLLYWLAVAALALGGVLLCVDLFKQPGREKAA